MAWPIPGYVTLVAASSAGSANGKCGNLAADRENLHRRERREWPAFESGGPVTVNLCMALHIHERFSNPENNWDFFFFFFPDFLLISLSLPYNTSFSAMPPQYTLLTTASRTFHQTRALATVPQKFKSIAIRREDKSRWERRAPLTPDAVERLIKDTGTKVYVQPSTKRVFKDEKYSKVSETKLDGRKRLHNSFCSSILKKICRRQWGYNEADLLRRC